MQDQPPVPAVPSYAPVKSGGDWKKPAIIGGLIGGSIILAAIILAPDPKPQAAAEKNAPAPQDKVEQTSQASAETPSSNAPASAAPPPAAAPAAPAAPPVQSRPQSSTRAHSSAATLVGQSGGAINVRKGAGTHHEVAHIGYPGDQVDVLASGSDKGGKTWYQVRFPKSQATGWISGDYLQQEDRSYTPLSGGSSNQAEENVRTDLETNATIVGSPGSKNIRSGPGPAYGELHIAYPGDRVLVTDSNTGTDGEPWYKVYFAQSGAEGWISGFLLKFD